MTLNTLGLMGAMPEEVALIVKELNNAKTEEYAGVDYHIGTRGKFTLVVCCGGMGKANAASTTQVLITKYAVDAIIFSGIAGNMNPNIGIADVVISETLRYHDAEDRMLAQSAPGTALYKANPALILALEKACKSLNVRFITGTIATGDQFVGDPAIKQKIHATCKPDCVEMEGAAVAQIAMRNNVPFVVLRSMSDNADESVTSLGAENFEISAYVKTSSSIVLHALDSLL